MDDKEIRFELIKICSRNDYPANGISDMLFDAKILYDFIKDGATPKIESIKND